MKAIYTGLFIILLSTVFAYSQAPDWSWVSSIDAASNEIKPFTVTVDSFGNMFVAGSFKDDMVTFGNTTLDGVSGSGKESPFLVKYNFKGEVIWAVEPTGQGSNSSSYANYQDIAVDQQGNIYLMGRYKSSSLIFGSYVLGGTQTGSSYYENAFVVKYDAGGNALWALSLGGSYDDSGYGIAVDDQNNVYCLGSFASTILKVQHLENGVITQDTLRNKNTSTTKRDIFLVKYTGDGELSWATSIGDSANTQLANGLALANNGIYIAGSWTAGSGTAITIGPSTIIASGYADALLVKTDLNGTIEWANSYGGSQNDYAYRVEASSDAIYLGGRFSSNSFQVGNTTLTNQGGDDIFISKISIIGNEIWTTTLQSADDDFLQGMSIQDSKWIYLTGYYQDDPITCDTITISNKGERDAFYAKYDSSGKVVWAIGYGGTLSENGYDITNDEDGNVYIIGNYMSTEVVIGDDTLTNSGLNTDYNLLLAALIDYSDTVSIIDTTKIYRFDNGGLYGGTSADLTYSQNNRLFSGIETPASLFISDDDATSWYQAFDNDSLEYNNEIQGWSGKATRILSNQNAWVAVQTNHPKEKYSSVVISYSNGDTNTWKTAVDPTMLSAWGYGSYSASAIGLSDYTLYAAMGPCIVKVGTGPINASTDITNVTTAISGLSSSVTVNSIAVANHSNAYPYYIAIDQSGNANGYNRLLYKYNGATYSQVSLPSNLNGVRAVFTHPAQTTGDTIFISGKDINTNAYKIYRSYDAGSNWVDISYSSATDFLSDVDYSVDWGTLVSSSNGIILIIPGNAISKDLGTTWEVLGTSHSANAVKPDNIHTIVGSAKTVEISTSGTTGTFTRTPSYGLESLQVNKIARTENETVFYIATKTGLGYTTAYLDTSISAGEKWSTPYGIFPLLSDSINFGAVDIDPTDSLHVIAGCPYGFFTSTTGASGFSLVTPSGFSATNDPQVNDVAFINHQLALAVTGGDSSNESGKGNIWRTTDGGLSWNNVSPTGFKSGNTIAIGENGIDTVIYIGTGLLNVDSGYLWKSYDFGISWERIKNGPTSMAGTSVLGLPINDIAVDPRGTDTLYIAAGYENEYAFVLSLDGGQTYIYLNSYAEKPYTSIAINLEHPDTVYTASGREIYLYDLLNNNFRFVFRGLPDEQIPDLMTGSILAGTTVGFFTFDPDLDNDVADTTSIPETQTDQFMVTIYPNPFSTEAMVNIVMRENALVTIELYDLMGRKVKQIYNGKNIKGSTNYEISSEGLAEGSYLVQIKINNLVNRRLLYHIK